MKTKLLVEDKIQNHILFADVLKIMASFAVVMIHVIAIEWETIDGNSWKWNVMNIYDSLLRWCIPIFVMVTGMLLLPHEKEITISKVFTKYIKKVVILLIFWTTIYYIFNSNSITKQVTLKWIFVNWLNSNYHLWYLYMLIGLYLVTPFLKEIVKNKKMTEYFLILWFVLECCMNLILKLPKFKIFDIVYTNLSIQLVLGYVGYYVLGYYLNTYSICKNHRKIIYVLGIIATFIIIVVTRLAKINEFKLTQIVYDFLSAPVALSSVAVFVGIRQIFFEKTVRQKWKKVINDCTRLSLGVYLIHALIIYLTEDFIIKILNIRIELMIPIVSGILYLICMGITYVISKIPKIGKYIV